MKQTKQPKIARERRTYSITVLWSVWNEVDTVGTSQTEYGRNYSVLRARRGRYTLYRSRGTCHINHTIHSLAGNQRDQGPSMSRSKQIKKTSRSSSFSDTHLQTTRMKNMKKTFTRNCRNYVTYWRRMTRQYSLETWTPTSDQPPAGKKKSRADRDVAEWTKMARCWLTFVHLTTWSSEAACSRVLCHSGFGLSMSL